MKKEYWFIILAYIVMQLSGGIGAPLLLKFELGRGLALEQAQVNAVAYWSIISFTVTLLLVLILLRKELFSPTPTLRGAEKASIGMSVLWAVIGIFMAFFAQSFAIMLETAIGIEQGSENTQTIISIITKVPLFAVITAIVGPILEEVVFRKIIFGSVYKKTNFFIAALISSIIFGLAHFEIEHLLLYSAMGFTFAFLYVKTQRILVPIFAHVAMNTIVVVTQVLMQDELEQILNEMEQVQSFIGGVL